MHSIKAHAYVLLATVLIAGSFIASEQVSVGVPPISLNLLRFMLATFCLLPFIVFNKKYRSEVIKVLPRGLVISFFYCGYFVCLFSALRTTTVLNTGTLYTLMPLMTALISIPIFKNRIKLSSLGAYLLGALGTLWVIFKGDIQLLSTLELNNGDLVFLLGVVSMCCYTITLRKLYRQDSVIVMTFCTLLGGIFWMTTALFISGAQLNWSKLTDVSHFFSMGYLAIAATFLTAYLYQKASTELKPSSVTAYIYLNPALIAILTFFIKGTALSATIWVGILVSVIATCLLHLFSTKDN